MVTLSELANSLDASDMLGHIRNFPSDLASACLLYTSDAADE